MSVGIDERVAAGNYNWSNYNRTGNGKIFTLLKSIEAGKTNTGRSSRALLGVFWKNK